MINYFSISWDAKKLFLPTKNGSCAKNFLNSQNFVVRTTHIYHYFLTSPPNTYMRQFKYLLMRETSNEKQGKKKQTNWSSPC